MSFSSVFQRIDY